MSFMAYFIIRSDSYSLLFFIKSDEKDILKRGDDIMYEILKTLSKPNMSILMIMKLYY